MTLPLLEVDTRLFGDADGCRRAAVILERAAGVLTEARRQVDDAMTVTLAWQGTMTGALGMSVGEDRVLLTGTMEATSRLTTAIKRFADELDRASETLVAARQRAADDGLTLTADAIVLTSSELGPGGLMMPADPGLDAASHRAGEAVATARARESAAHQALAAAWANDAPFWMDALRDVGLFPPASDEVFDRGMWGTGLALTGLSATAERKATDLRWRNVGNLLGPAGTAITFFTTTREQLAADADDRSLSTADRWGRALVMGGSRTSGSVAGNLVGGNAARGLGTLLGLPAAPDSAGVSVPLATIAVGTMGSIVGGWGGDKLGKAAGSEAVEGVDEVNDAIESAAMVATDAADDAVDAATDAVGEGLDAVGDGLEDAGGKLKDAGDWLVRWR